MGKPPSVSIQRTLRRIQADGTPVECTFPDWREWLSFQPDARLAHGIVDAHLDVQTA